MVNGEIGQSEEFVFDENSMGEHPDISLEEPVARYANGILSSIGDKPTDVVFDFGNEEVEGKKLGQVPINKLLFSGEAEEGKLKVTVQEKVKVDDEGKIDEKGKYQKVVIITTTVIAVGVVLAGINNLRIRRDK